MPNFKSGMPAFGDRIGPRRDSGSARPTSKAYGATRPSWGSYIRESQALVSENDPLPSPLEWNLPPPSFKAPSVLM